QIISAVGNPQQQASTDQLGSILGVAQQVVGNHGVDPGSTQAIMSLLGNHVRSSLQSTQANQGTDQVQSLVNQFAGFGSNPQAVSALFPGGQQQQVSEDIAQRTGIDFNMIQSMLPVLIPVVLNMLQAGQTQGAQSGGNPVLNTFLDSNHDGNVDLGDVMGMAGQFLSQRQ
ncbi:MAG TPA: DUF937 domain-containing protein, partial [Leptolyngbya sp.]|nr:DUF937 domain-containing protein [Leptolyngbya sp.]